MSRAKGANLKAEPSLDPVSIAKDRVVHLRPLSLDYDSSSLIVTRNKNRLCFKWSAAASYCGVWDEPIAGLGAQEGSREPHATY